MNKSKEYRVLSGSMLKLIALTAMIIDHIGSVLLREIPWATEPLFMLSNSFPFSLYAVSRYIGRIAFPIYVFLLTEGYIHTRDRKKYGINLLAFALISEIPWNLEHSGSIFYSGQNVFFTLFLGYLGINVTETFKDDKKRQSLLLLALLVISIVLRADYGITGFGFILLMYVLRDNKTLRAVSCAGVLNTPYFAMLAFIPIGLYNEKRGFIKGKAAKYAFYAAYPVHMIILYLIKLNYFGYAAK